MSSCSSLLVLEDTAAPPHPDTHRQGRLQPAHKNQRLGEL